MNYIELLEDGFYQTSYIEIAAVITSIIYAWLASKNNIWCWLFGIISPILTMYALYFYFQLYAEVYLQVYYIGMAIYGFYTWKYGSINHKEKAIAAWPLKTHAIVVFIGFILAFILGFILKNYTDAASTYLDSFTTVFAIIATFMTAQRILENWIYWIIIDSVSIFLYFDRGGYLFAVLFIVYTIIAIYGFVNWRKKYRLEHV
jgi:nicotinamide mononucleotide transporter